MPSAASLVSKLEPLSKKTVEQVTTLVDPITRRATKAISNPLLAADHILNRLGSTKLPTVPVIGEHIVKAEAGSLPIRDFTNHRGKARYLLSELFSTGDREKALEDLTAISALGKDRLAKERTYKMYTGMLGTGAGVALAPVAQHVISPVVRATGELVKFNPHVPGYLSNYGDDLLSFSQSIDSQGLLPLMGILGYSGLKRGRNLGQAIIDRRARSKLLNAINAGTLSRAELETIADTAARRGII